jgi:hypothetical protein
MKKTRHIRQPDIDGRIFMPGLKKILTSTLEDDFMDTIILYTTHGCTYCQRVKEFLSERDVGYSEHNIEDDPDARREMMEIPGIT